MGHDQCTQYPWFFIFDVDIGRVPRYAQAIQKEVDAPSSTEKNPVIATFPGKKFSLLPLFIATGAVTPVNKSPNGSFPS